MKNTKRLFPILLGVLLPLAGGIQAQPEHSLHPTVRVVAQFLELTPDQVAGLLRLRNELQEDVQPLKEEIKAHKKVLAEELQSDGPDPEVVGELTIWIHQLTVEIRQLHRAYVQNFVGLLDTDEQLRRWRLIQIAARLQPYLPAFRQLGLVGQPGAPHRELDEISTERDELLVDPAEIIN